MTTRGYCGLLLGTLWILFPVAAGAAEVRPSEVPQPITDPATGKRLIVLPEDWKDLYPFSARFAAARELAQSETPGLGIHLAAVSFATEPLVSVGTDGVRTFRDPDSSTFAPDLIRAPFEEGTHDLFVVQAPDPKLLTMLHRELEAIGARILGSVPDTAYLASLNAAQHSRLAASPAVFWIGKLQPAWRIAPKLDYVIESDPDHLLTLTALFDRRAHSAANQVAELLAGAGVTVLDVSPRERDFKARFRAEAAKARTVASMPSCLWIERFASYRLDNNVARTSTDTPTGRGGVAGPLMDVEDVWERGLRGEGQIAAVSDTGLSTGDFSTLHHDFGRQGSPTNPMRVVAGYALGRGTWDDDQTIPGAGHGTHVAGSLVGNGVRSGSDPASNHFPASSYAGTAPKAGLVFQSLLDAGGGLGGIPTDLNTLFQAAYDDGARVHSNSWGTPVDGQYTSDAQDVDEFVWNHPDMVITYTAGNEGEDGQTRVGSFCFGTADPIDGVIDDDAIGAPGTAKNNITVGAAENYRPGFTFEAPQGDCTSSDGVEQKTWGWFSDCRFSVSPLFPDLMADDASGLAAFSSRGPTDDGRFKPDLVAPGVAVISTRTDQNQTYQQWGSCDVPAALQPYYITLGGTSMANPLAAGAAVLTRQYYVDGWHGEGNAHTNLYPIPADGFSPSAALVKATLINGAWDLDPGQYGVGPDRETPPAWDTGSDLPNHAEGYGRLDLEASLFPASGFSRDPGRDMAIHDVGTGLSTGQFADHPVVIDSSTDPLVVTLVWSDPYAALAAGSQLVNDLDLTVTSPGSTVYLPNGVDRTTGGADRTNNVEQVKVTAPAVGTWNIRVSGFNVPGNGEAGTTAQPYALVISGVMAPTCTQPAALSGFTATPIATNRIDLAWISSSADSYSVHRSTAPGGPYERVASGLLTPAYSDTSVSGGVAYYYVVTAISDPNCESSFSNEATATAFGDCTLAPDFSGLTSVGSVAGGASCVLRLEWSEASTSCPGPIVYNVYRSPTPDFIPGPANLLEACITQPFFEDDTAVNGTTYHYAVRAEDATVGNGGSCRGGNEDLGNLQVSGEVGGDVTSVVFADDFDGNQAPGDLWHFPPANDPLNANPYPPGDCASADFTTDWYRPETGFCTGNTLASNDGAANPTYSNLNYGHVVLGLPPSTGAPFSDGGILLPSGVSSISLTFDHDYDFESSFQDWDGGRVRISVDDWPNFVDLAPVGGYPGTVTTSTFFCTPFPGVDAYVDDSGGCVGATFDLTAYAGSRVWLAWNHGGDDTNQTDSGWAIDNVRLEATTPSPCATPPAPRPVPDRHRHRRTERDRVAESFGRQLRIDHDPLPDRHLPRRCRRRHPAHRPGGLDRAAWLGRSLEPHQRHDLLLRCLRRQWVRRILGFARRLCTAFRYQRCRALGLLHRSVGTGATRHRLGLRGGQRPGAAFDGNRESRRHLACGLDPDGDERTGPGPPPDRPHLSRRSHQSGLPRLSGWPRLRGRCRLGSDVVDQPRPRRPGAGGTGRHLHGFRRGSRPDPGGNSELGRRERLSRPRRRRRIHRMDLRQRRRQQWSRHHFLRCDRRLCEPTRLFHQPLTNRRQCPHGLVPELRRHQRQPAVVPRRRGLGRRPRALRRPGLRRHQRRRNSRPGRRGRQRPLELPLCRRRWPDQGPRRAALRHLGADLQYHEYGLVDPRQRVERQPGLVTGYDPRALRAPGLTVEPPRLDRWQ